MDIHSSKIVYIIFQMVRIAFIKICCFSHVMWNNLLCLLCEKCSFKRNEMYFKSQWWILIVLVCGDIFHTIWIFSVMPINSRHLKKLLLYIICRNLDKTHLQRMNNYNGKIPSNYQLTKNIANIPEPSEPPNLFCQSYFSINI